MPVMRPRNVNRSGPAIEISIKTFEVTLGEEAMESLLKRMLRSAMGCPVVMPSEGLSNPKRCVRTQNQPVVHPCPMRRCLAFFFVLLSYILGPFESMLSTETLECSA